MKLLFLAAILTFVFGDFAPQIKAQTDPPPPQTISARVGKQKKATRSGITVKFVSLVEDSRCAEGTRCVWAGNARIKVTVSKAGSNPITFEANTNEGEKGSIYEGYAIYLTDLTPTPKANIRLNRNAYTATFSVSRLSR